MRISLCFCLHKSLRSFSCACTVFTCIGVNFIKTSRKCVIFFNVPPLQAKERTTIHYIVVVENVDGQADAGIFNLSSFIVDSLNNFLLLLLFFVNIS